MLEELTQKNCDETIYFMYRDSVLFKIHKVKTNKSDTFIFFDYTYKDTKFIGFNDLDVAKTAVKIRFDEYKEKYLNKKRISHDN